MKNALKNVLTLGSMRSKFEIPQSRMKNIQWFPGHMGRGLKDINAHLKSIDIVIEVHDARIPFSGRNQLLHKSVANIRPILLVLNKKDLIDKKFEKLIQKEMKDQSHIKKVIFTNCRDEFCKGVRSLLPTLQEVSDTMPRYHRSEVLNTTVMVVGVPNVGKSSIINALRSSNMKKGKATPVGAVAGVTRSVMNKVKISDSPLIYILDTPGISLPHIDHLETGLKLAACATLQDHLVGVVNIADYILFHMNRGGNYRYVDFFGLDEPSDDITMLLAKAAIKKKNYRRSFDVSTNSFRMFPNIDDTAKSFIQQFRKGNFGCVMFDRELLDTS